MARIKSGEIFEILTPKGFAYLHYIGKNSMNIELIRVLKGLYDKRPVHFDDLAKENELFIVSFPLSAALNKKIISKVGSYSSEGFYPPSFMRTPLNIKGEFLGWHIVNTTTLARELVPVLSEDQKNISPWGVWNDTLLVDRLSSGWTLAKWDPWD